ncbi:MAG: SMP-30/gluconolactonase/LRE family protein [Bacteroidota bacterium]
MHKIYYSVLFLLAFSALTAQEASTFHTRPGAYFEGITWAPDGKIYVVDYVSGEVFRLTTKGTAEKLGAYSGALGGAADQAGNFYFSEFNTGKVIKITPDNQSEVYVSGLIGPSGILIDPNDEWMYIANYSGSRISKVNMKADNPKPETLAAGGMINGPDGLAFSPEGDIISANFEDNSIQRITVDGEVSRFARVTASIRTGYIVRWKDGYLVTGVNGPKIFHISDQGDVTSFIGTNVPGYANGDASVAQFDLPNGIAISPNQDSLLITESTAAGRIRLVTGLDLTSSLEAPILRADPVISPIPSTDFLDCRMYLEKSAFLEVRLLDMSGRIVDTLMAEQKPAGTVEKRFPLMDYIAPGPYVFQVLTDGQVFNRKIVVE